MKVRFEVDEIAAFRNGVNPRRRVYTLDIDPSKLTPEQRNLIADRLWSKHVHALDSNRASAGRIKVANPTLEGLLAAIEANENEVKESENHPLSKTT